MNQFPKFNTVVETRFGKMICNMHDRFIGKSLIKYGEFSHAECFLFQELIKSGAVVIEAGANVGAHTLFLANQVGPDGIVYAFEPQRIVFQTLCGNLALNSIPNVIAMQSAVGFELGQIQVPQPDYCRIGNFGGLSLEGSGEGEIVPIVSIDSLLLQRCDFIKADVEGMEEVVLRGGEKTIRKHRPVLYVESDREDKRLSLLRFVDSMGYDMFLHMPLLFNENNFRSQSENIFPGLVSANVLCVCKSMKMELPSLIPLSVIPS